MKLVLQYILLLLFGLQHRGAVADYDHFKTRNLWFPAAAAASRIPDNSTVSTHAQDCLNNLQDSNVQSPINITVLHEYDVPCDILNLNNDSIKCAGYLAISPTYEAIILSFRGTQNDTNQLVEEFINIAQEPFLNNTTALANIYFQFAYYRVWNATTMSADYMVVKNDYPNYKVMITGHSMGGAMAVLAATHISLVEGLPTNGSMELVTFGEPRVGNDVFSDLVDSLISYHFRVINAADRVPHVPYNISDILIYEHHLTEVWYPYGMSSPNYTVCNTTKEDPSCSNSLGPQNDGSYYSVPDHLQYFDAYMDLYVSNNCSYDGAEVTTTQSPSTVEDTLADDAAKMAVSNSPSVGFDSIMSISSSTFQCLRKNGQSFYIGRGTRADGTMDSVGFQNMKNAIIGGFTEVDVYYVPCQTGDGLCDLESMNGLAGALVSQGITVGTLWMDVTGAWTSNQTLNSGYIDDMIHEALNVLIIGCDYGDPGDCHTKVGIYTTAKDWNAIVGPNCTQFSTSPLWWANFDGDTNTTNFEPFGGWTFPTIKAYAQNVNGPCGVTMNMDAMNFTSNAM